jgi:hypothetical protein
MRGGVTLPGGVAHDSDDNVRILWSALAAAFSNPRALPSPEDRRLGRPLDWAGLDATLWWAETFLTSHPSLPSVSHKI